MFWILIFGLLYFLNIVCAITNNNCYTTIKENFHVKGDVKIGAFFSLHIYYTGNNIPDTIDPYYFKDVHLQNIMVNICSHWDTATTLQNTSAHFWAF
uniref:Vomeronasal 2, receptor 90 n=1 Tax=Mus musculus TaxID=10090 RepID=A0A338P6K0_MOUSE